MSVRLYKTNRLTEDINRHINKWLGSGATVTEITTALNAASTALAAVTPVPTHSRVITDTGAAMNPTQPRNI